MEETVENSILKMMREKLKENEDSVQTSVTITEFRSQMKKNLQAEMQTDITEDDDLFITLSEICYKSMKGCHLLSEEFPWRDLISLFLYTVFETMSYSTEMPEGN